MQSEHASAPVIHNRDASRFELHVDDRAAVLEYRRQGDRMTIHHTFVPPELRGQNLAGRLAGSAFEFARAEQLKIVPQCSYIGTYARRYPEVRDLLA